MRIKIREKNIFSKLIMEKYSCLLSVDMINGISIDSREVKKGDIFIGLIGDNIDGSIHAGEALDLGASLVVVNRKKNIIKNSKILEVESTSNFLYDFSKLWLKNFDCEFIGITGSNGKTSTKEILYKFFSTSFNNSVADEKCSSVRSFLSFNSMIRASLLGGLEYF